MSPLESRSGASSKFERFFQFLAGRSEVLKQFHFVIEMDHEVFVLVFAKHVVEKAVACRAFLAEDPPLAHAGVHQQA